MLLVWGTEIMIPGILCPKNSFFSFTEVFCCVNLYSSLLKYWDILKFHGVQFNFLTCDTIKGDKRVIWFELTVCPSYVYGIDDLSKNGLYVIVYRIVMKNKSSEWLD